MDDVDGVLDAMGEDGPFVLLGASFSGLVASAYAVAHPERTAGVLLLDSSIPDDYIEGVGDRRMSQRVSSGAGDVAGSP